MGALNTSNLEDIYLIYSTYDFFKKKKIFFSYFAHGKIIEDNSNGVTNQSDKHPHRFQTFLVKHVLLCCRRLVEYGKEHKGWFVEKKEMCLLQKLSNVV